MCQLPPNKLTKPVTGTLHSSVVTQKVWNVKSPGSNGDEVNSWAERLYALMSHPLLRADLVIQREGLDFKQSKERSRVQGVLFSSWFYVVLFSWWHSLPSSSEIQATDGDYILSIYTIWVLSFIVSPNTGRRQDGFQMAENGLELSSAWSQTHRLLHSSISRHDGVCD